MSGRPPTLAVTVTEVVAVTPLIKRFRLEAVDGGLLPAFAGGAHVTVELQDGDVLRRNAYSLMSRPSDRAHYMISVRRDDAGRGGSRYLHDRIQPGATLAIGHPVNLFAVEQRARKHLLVAGGIGITPFLAVIDQLDRDHRAFELHYAARSRAHAAYADDLVAAYGSRIHLYHDDQGERLDLARLLGHQPLGTHLYVCGPSSMIDGVLGAARRAGWPEQTLHVERFVAPPTGAPYAVDLARSGRRVTVGTHQSMLEAIEAAGVDAPFLCRGGACGQCEAAVLSCDGILRHHDHVLTDDEKAAGRKVMPCVSRFEGARLVLDL